MAVEDGLLLLEQEPPSLSQDQRAELGLGALVCGVIVILIAMVVFVVVQGLPSFAHNGLHWFGAGGNINTQLANIASSGQNGGKGYYTFHAWPLIWSTILTTVGGVTLAFICSLFTAVFMVEFAPPFFKRVLEPVIRVLASVPSVVYGLIGVVVVTPFIGSHLITQQQIASVAPTVQLSGPSLLAGVAILTVMITPIMVAMFSEGLRATPNSWIEGSLALGVNRWRTFWNIAVRTARPAIVAGTVLATARAVGEAVMLSMVSGSIGFSPNPFDGLIFFFEPSRGLAPTILANTDDFSFAPMRATLFAIATVLLCVSLVLSLTGWYSKLSMKHFFLAGGAAA